MGNFFDRFIRRMTPPESKPDPYPEHTKLEKIHSESQELGEFLEWLAERYTLCLLDEREDEYMPARVSVQVVLAEYFDIDLEKLEDEKQAMLEKIRADALAEQEMLNRTTTLDFQTKI